MQKRPHNAGLRIILVYRKIIIEVYKHTHAHRYTLVHLRLWGPITDVKSSLTPYPNFNNHNWMWDLNLDPNTHTTEKHTHCHPRHQFIYWCVLVHPHPLKTQWGQAKLITIYQHSKSLIIYWLRYKAREHREQRKSRDDGRRVNVVLMRSCLKWWGGGGAVWGERLSVSLFFVFL